MRKFLASFRWARHGLQTVWREEANFRTEIFLGVAMLAFAFLFDFSFIEWVIVIACITIVLAAEVVNTVIEDLCNKIEPHHDPAIGKIKDMAAAFVLLAVSGAGIMGALLIASHFFDQY